MHVYSRTSIGCDIYPSNFTTALVFLALYVYFCLLVHVLGVKVWETECAGIFNLTECEENGVKKCSQYWPDGIDETKEFTLGDGKRIIVTRIDKDLIQDIINEEDSGNSSQAREKKKLRKVIADKDKFEIRTFNLECEGETREVSQYHVKFWKDNTGLLDGEHVEKDVTEMRDFLHFLVEEVDTHCRNKNTGPPIIHCRHVYINHALTGHTHHNVEM